MRESYGPEDDGYDDEPPTVDNATSSAVNATVLNQDETNNETAMSKEDKNIVQV
jgi:hypothetical protein